MPRTRAHGGPSSVLVALSLVGAGAGGVALPGPSPQAAASDLALSLTPDAAVLDVESARRGAVSFTVHIRNEGATTVTVAHPSICFPADFVPGDTRRREDTHGRSEILLTIERPDGERVILRAGLLGFFEPGNVDHLEIPPGGTRTFHLGWFFENARGMWEDDGKAWSVFRNEGAYAVSVLFRNAFPRAWIRDESTGRARVVEAWTGEMESQAVTVTVGPGGR